MSRVGIVVPTWHYFSDPFKLQPLYELYLATVLDDYFAGSVEVAMYDLREARRHDFSRDPDEIASLVPERDIYLYWIMKSADSVEMAAISQCLRKRYPRSVHVAGGTHVDVFPELSARQFDAIVRGPGEETMKLAVDNACRGCLQRVYTGEWASVQYRDYPFPRRSFLPEDAVVNRALFEKYGRVLGTSVLFSRGCNFRCAYCVYNVPGTIQIRTPSQIQEEILYLKQEYGVTGINLRDEICVPMLPKVATPFLEAIGSTDVIWRGQTRVGAPPDIMKLAKQSGCVELALGVESVSQEVLDIVQKGQRIEDVRRTFAICKELDIKTKMCLILGLPGEPRNILDQTISFIEEVQPDYVNVSGFCPTPGSRIFEKKDEYGIAAINDNWSKHAHLMMRFSDEEHFGLPFNYAPEGPWGAAFSNAEILKNIKMLQTYLRDNNRSY